MRSSEKTDPPDRNKDVLLERISEEMCVQAYRKPPDHVLGFKA